MGRRQRSKNFTLDILKELKGYADNWKDEYGYWFSVYSTPSESLTDRFNRLDKEKYGVIKDITDKDYYQNSFHYDVRKKLPHLKKLILKKIIQNFALADSFIIVNIQKWFTIRKHLRLYGITPMIV